MKIREFNRYVLSPKLVADGEKNAIGKAKALEQCLSKWPEEYVRVEEEAREHYARANQDLSDETLSDITFCHFAYGFNPDEYLSCNLADAAPEERRNFISSRETKTLVYCLNDIVDIDIFYNKSETYKRYGQFYKREVLGISGDTSLEELSAFMEGKEAFVQKKERLSKGDGIKLVKVSSIVDPKAYLDELKSEGGYVLEELIEQSAIMAQLNPTSVNTVRFITLHTDRGIEILYTFSKVGRNGSFVDNGGAGGLLVGIDRETGIMTTDARDEFGYDYDVHPDNGLRFKGFQVPDWGQALALAAKAASLAPKVAYIGWDLAYTNDGWVIVEGNSGSQLIGPQIVYQKGMKEDFMSYARRAVGVLPVEM